MALEQRWACSLAVVLAACGNPGTTPDAASQSDAASHNDAPAPACSGAGTGTFSGTVSGATISPVVSAQVTTFAGLPTLVVAETTGPNLCAPNAAMSAFGDYLDVVFCARAVGTYSLFGPVPSCPGSMAGATFGLDQGTSTIAFKATAGMLAITSADAMCVLGTFDITFDSGDSVTGTFQAAVCP